VKATYSPRFRATVDGKPADVEFIAPSFMGVKVPAGEHVVQFWYKSYPSYLWLFLLSGLGVAGLVVFDVRARRARERAGARAGAPDPTPDGAEPGPADGEGGRAVEAGDDAMRVREGAG
jgi:hypothetical protein